MTPDRLDRLEKTVNAYMDAVIFQEADPGPYRLKQAHTTRVCAHIVMLARSLDLPGGMVNRAAAAALVHDLGRFPQYRTFETFSDPLSRNHAALGVREICRHRMLEGIPRGERQAILRAVALHNCRDLPGNLDRDLDLLARLLRDADKMDIFRVMADLYTGPSNGQPSYITHHHPDDGRVSPELAQRVADLERVPYVQVKSLNDMKLFQLSMIFDLNFPAARRQVLEAGRVQSVLSSMPRFRLAGRLEATLVRYMEDRPRGQAAQAAGSEPLKK